VVLAKPITYMNLSGESIAELLRWYKLQPTDMLVVCDDLDLPVGKVRLRTKGSAGGQHGLENIIARLHTNDFPRLRIGIGRPVRNRPAPVNYLLSAPSTEDRILLEAAEDRAAEAIPLIITQGLEAAMNVVNADPEAEQKAAEKRRMREERREQERLRKEAEQQAHADDPSKGGESGLSSLTT
jgi:PTH1 family peptidyl-tRNA hydrolase